MPGLKGGGGVLEDHANTAQGGALLAKALLSLLRGGGQVHANHQSEWQLGPYRMHGPLYHQLVIHPAANRPAARPAALPPLTRTWTKSPFAALPSALQTAGKQKGETPSGPASNQGRGKDFDKTPQTWNFCRQLGNMRGMGPADACNCGPTWPLLRTRSQGSGKTWGLFVCLFGGSRPTHCCCCCCCSALSAFTVADASPRSTTTYRGWLLIVARAVIFEKVVAPSGPKQ